MKNALPVVQVQLCLNLMEFIPGAEKSQGHIFGFFVLAEMLSQAGPFALRVPGSDDN